MPHELFLGTTQTTKIINSFVNNMSTDIKFSKAQTSIIIQSSGSFGLGLDNLGKKARTNSVTTLAWGSLPGLVSNLASNTTNKLERKISGQEATTRSCHKEIYLFRVKLKMILLKS